MALYTYDEEADALYVLLVPEAQTPIARTVEFSGRLHMDLNAAGTPIAVEILYPSQGDMDRLKTPPGRLWFRRIVGVDYPGAL